MQPAKVNQILKAAAELVKDNKEHWKNELRVMSLVEDITSSSKSTTVNGFTVTVTIEREEEEL